MKIEYESILKYSAIFTKYTLVRKSIPDLFYITGKFRNTSTFASNIVVIEF